MKLGQIGLFMESSEYAERSNLEGGSRWAWGRMGPTPGRPHPDTCILHHYICII
jgi:hypothetical protein